MAGLHGACWFGVLCNEWRAGAIRGFVEGDCRKQCAPPLPVWGEVKQAASPSPHRLDHPAQNLVEDRARCGEIHPYELGAGRLEGLAGAEADLCLLQEELVGRGRQL